MLERKRRESGEGQAGCLFGLILLALGALIAIKLVPVKVSAAEVRQTMEDEAKSAGTHNDDKIRGAIYMTAQQDHLPITPEDIKIKRQANTIVIDVDYTVPVYFPGYIYMWHIDTHVENPIF